MKKYVATILALAMIGILIGTVIIPAIAQGGASVPTTINYQGYLEDLGGPVTQTDLPMQFALYETSEGGTPVWREMQSVDVTDGLFSVMLGSGSPIATSDLTGTRYLGVSVNGDSEMTPRQQMTSVAYAFWADKANSALALDAADGYPENAVYVNEEGSVGVGTLDPNGALDVGTLPEYGEIRFFSSFSGLDDMSVDEGSVFTGDEEKFYIVQVYDSVVSPDTFKWSDDDCATWSDEIDMSTSWIDLNDGVRVRWDSTDGHNGGGGGRGDFWDFRAYPPCGDALVVRTGMVGIGTGTPTAELDVRGDAFFEGNVGIGTGTPTGALTVFGTASFDGKTGTGTPTNALMVSGTASFDGAVIIGTGTPTSPLTVSGTIEATAGGYKFPDGTLQTTAANVDAGGYMQQLIRNFVVASGPGVTAGDVVTFLDGYVQKGFVKGDTIDKWGPETLAHPAQTYYTSAAALSDSSFVVAYRDEGGLLGHGTAVIGEICGETVTYGGEYEFNDNGDTTYISVTALSDAKIVVAYRDQGNSGKGTAVAGEVTGTYIKFGNEYLFNDAATSHIFATGLTDTTFVVHYRDEGNFDRLTGRKGTTSIGSLSMSFNSEGLVIDSACSRVSSARLSDTHFILAFRDDGASGNGKVTVGRIDGSSLNYGGAYTFNSAATYWTSVDTFSGTKFVIAYSDQGNSYYGTAIIGDTYGTYNEYITLGSEWVFNAAQTYPLSVATLSGSRFVVAYSDRGNSYYGTAIIGDVSGTDITYSSEDVFNPATIYWGFPVLRITDSRFLVLYADEGYSHFGVVRIGALESGLIVGIAREAKAAGQTVPVIIGGISTVHSGLTPGETYYADVSGNLTTEVTANRIGYALSSSELLLDIEQGEWE